MSVSKELVFTKTLVDQAPITLTKVEYKPCLNYTRLSRDYENARFHPLERYRYDSSDGNDTCEYDERFYQLENFKTNEYIV